MSPNCRLTCTLLLLVLIPGSTAVAGKLNELRERARAKSTASSSRSPSSAATNDNDQQDDEDDRHANKKEHAALQVGKLSKIAAATRSARVPPATPASRPPRPGRAPMQTRSPRIPRRDHFHFGLQFNHAYPPTILEEHYHFVNPPIVVRDCVGSSVPTEPIYSATPIVPEFAVPMPVSATPEPTAILPPWHARFGIEYGSDIEDLSRFGFDLLAHQTGGLGIDTAFRLHRENGAEFRDHLWLGDFNIVYELFPNQHVRPRAGLGMNWMADGYGAEVGFNLTVGADVFLGPALAISGQLDMGTLGDADLFHGSATVGILQTEHLEWFAGYDHLDVGGAEIRGLVAGIRFRF